MVADAFGSTFTRDILTFSSAQGLLWGGDHVGRIRLAIPHQRIQVSPDPYSMTAIMRDASGGY